MREINEIIIHCAATPEDKHFTVEDIDKWHKDRGFKSIGYHYVIYLNGAIHKGREEKEIGAHCVKHNKNSIGICYIGGVDSDGKTPKDTRTELQKESLLYLLKDLKKRYPEAVICGHNNFAKKACPSFNVNEEYKDI